MEKISLADKLARFSDRWHPRVIASLNGQEVKVEDHYGAEVAKVVRERRWDLPSALALASACRTDLNEKRCRASVFRPV